jgi:four helix bundle protein
MQDFKELKVWEKSHRFVLKIYETVSEFPKEERYGITSQLRRAASSIPTNIAEGCGRGSRAELGRFLQIAMGSATETEYHLILARDLKFIQEEEFHELEADIIEIKKMLYAFIKTLQTAP